MRLQNKLKQVPTQIDCLAFKMVNNLKNIYVTHIDASKRLKIFKHFYLICNSPCNTLK